MIGYALATKTEPYDGSLRRPEAPATLDLRDWGR
jgi:hypothetical protein